MPAKKHIHKYFLTSAGTWACGFSDCSHFMPLNVADQVEGKLTHCWECGSQMRLTKANMVDTHPKCDGCTIDANGMSLDDWAAATEAIERKNREKKAG